MGPLPPNRVEVGFHEHHHNHGRTRKPTPKRDRLATGSAAHVQKSGRAPMNRIVSYGLRNYAIRNRPYEDMVIITLGRCPGETSRSTQNGGTTLNASLHPCALLALTPASAKKTWHTGPD